MVVDYRNLTLLPSKKLTEMAYTYIYIHFFFIEASLNQCCSGEFLIQGKNNSQLSFLTQNLCFAGREIRHQKHTTTNILNLSTQTKIFKKIK